VTLLPADRANAAIAPHLPTLRKISAVPHKRPVASIIYTRKGTIRTTAAVILMIRQCRFSLMRSARMAFFGGTDGAAEINFFHHQYLVEFRRVFILKKRPKLS
jgi:hypothetical protein